MKLWQRIAALCLAACMCLALFACGETGSTQTEPDTTETTAAGDGTPEIGTYTVQVAAETGTAFEKIGVYIYEDNTLAELVWFAKTDEAGMISFSAPVQEGYVAVLEGIPQGYHVEESYPLANRETSIVLDIEMASGDDLANQTLRLGDVMCDLTVTDVNGNTYQISELLKEKDAVVLNFWFLACTPCKMEFPYLQKAYDKYSDSVAVLALNPIDSDNAQILAYAEELELTLPMAACDADIQKAMNLLAYPTTVVIDRYGIISLVHEGSITSARSFEDIFAYFTAEDYQPGVVEDVNDILSGEGDEEEYDNPTDVGGVSSFQLTVKPGEVVYCDVYRVSDMYMQIKSPNAYLLYNGKTYNPTNGTIGVMVYTPDVRTPATIGLGNNGEETETFTITFAALAGSLNNPYTMSLGEFDVSIPAGKEEGIYFQYVAESDGYLTVQCLSATAGVPYGYTLYNLNTYANRNLESDAVRDEEGNVVVQVKVTKGQVVQFCASALPDDAGVYPPIQMRFLATMGEGIDQEEEDDSDKILYAVTVTDENRNPIPNVQVYIETEDGTKTLTTGENGAAGMKLKPGSYKATLKVPVGYSARTTELTLTEKLPTQSVKFDTVVTENETYTVTVTDDSGAPIADVLVSLGESFTYTDASGVASFTLLKGSYTATIGIPEGYTADTLSYAFPENATSMTVVLTKGSGTGNPDEEKLSYSVKVTDYYGNPLKGVTVTFQQNGSAVGLQKVDDSGLAAAKLAKGQYTVSLAFDSGAYYYDEASAVLTEDVTSITIAAVAKRSGDVTSLYVGDAYYLPLGATYVDGMQANVTNYFIFKPTASGIYRFTTTDPTAVISYWGANDAFIQNQTSVTDYANNAFTREVREDQTENTIFILGVTGASQTIVEITRIGDIVLSDEEKAEWIYFTGTQAPAEGTTYKPTETGKLTYVDITADSSEYTLVKGSDGFYHLGSATGPLMYVNLGPNGRYISFYQMMGFEQAGGTFMRQYFYDETGKFLRKEEYTECLQAYTGAVDVQGYGVYPLTDDLIYILQNGGENKQWWDSTSPNYLFESLSGVNTEIAWMFNCCYFE